MVDLQAVRTLAGDLGAHCVLEPGPACGECTPCRAAAQLRALADAVERLERDLALASDDLALLYIVRAENARLTSPEHEREMVRQFLREQRGNLEPPQIVGNDPNDLASRWPGTSTGGTDDART